MFNLLHVNWNVCIHVIHIFHTHIYFVIHIYAGRGYTHRHSQWQTIKNMCNHLQKLPSIFRSLVFTHSQLYTSPSAGQNRLTESMFDETEGRRILENGDRFFTSLCRIKFVFRESRLDVIPFAPSIMIIFFKHRFTSTKDWYSKMILSFKFIFYLRVIKNLLCH